MLTSYRLSRVTGDRYAGEWPREQFRKHGIDYEVSDRAKSDIYRYALPMLNSGRIELLDDRRLRAQLASLERRTARGGRDSIDHPAAGYDDLANVATGAARLVAESAAAGANLTIAANWIADGGRGLRRAKSPWAIGDSSWRDAGRIA